MCAADATPEKTATQLNTLEFRTEDGEAVGFLLVKAKATDSWR